MSAEAALHWAGQTGVWVAALLGLVLVIRRPFAKQFGAQATYWLWALPAIRLVMPELRVLPATQSPPVRPDTLPTLSAVPTADADAAVAGAAALPPAAAPLLLALWLGVAALGFSIVQARHQRFRRAVIARSRPAPELVSALAETASQAGLRRVPDLRLDPAGLGPLVMGAVRPVVVLPADAAVRFSSAQLRHALLHECVHIRRRDLWAAHAALLFRALNWPNPLAHLAAPAFRADQEAATDAHVLRVSGDVVGYAETLLRAARHGAPTSDAPGPDALGLALSSPPHPSLETEP